MDIKNEPNFSPNSASLSSAYTKFFVLFIVLNIQYQLLQQPAEHQVVEVISF